MLESLKRGLFLNVYAVLEDRCSRIAIGVGDVLVQNLLGLYGVFHKYGPAALISGESLAIELGEHSPCRIARLNALHGADLFQSRTTQNEPLTFPGL